MNTAKRIGRCYAAVITASVVAAVALTGGCMSTQPGSSSLAHVVIEGATLADVRSAAIQVFTAERYEVTTSGETRLVFMREGTRQDQVRYGRYGQSLRMRVDVTLEPFSADSLLVRADAYAVHGDSMLGPTKLLKVVRRPYTRLLKQVRKNVAKL